MNEGFSEIMAQFDGAIQDLAIQARALIYDVMPDVVEVPWVRQRIIGYGVGPRKMSEQYAYISLHKGHVNLGFYYGSELPDPDKLLEGTGELMRHIKIRTSQDLENPAVRQLLEAASVHRMPPKAE
jgi:hypothetical protein